MTAPRATLKSRIELYSQLLHDSTPEQMKVSWREADRLICKLHEQELTQ